MDLESHISGVKTLCRLCGNRTQTPSDIATNRTLHKCSKYSEDIFKMCRIDTTYHEEGISPEHMCTSCELKLRLHNKRGNSTSNSHDPLAKQAMSTNTLWVEHSSTNCPTCDHIVGLSTCRGRKKKKVRGRPKAKAGMSPSVPAPTSASSMDMEVSEDALPSHPPPSNQPPSNPPPPNPPPSNPPSPNPPPSSPPSFTSPMDVSDSENALPLSSVQLSYEQGISLLNPQSPPDSNNLFKLEYLVNSINSISLFGTPSPNSNITISEPMDHSTPESQADVDQCVTPQKSLSITTQTTPRNSISSGTPNQSTVGTTQTTPRSVHRYDKHGNIIVKKSRGPSKTFVHVPEARVKSDQAMPRTIRRRTHVSRNIMKGIAGNDPNAIDAQYAANLKAHPVARRRIICAKAGIRDRSFMSTKMSVALKIQNHFSWRQHRTNKRYYKVLGIKYSSEKQERDYLKKQLSKDTIVAEEIPTVVKNKSRTKIEKRVCIRPQDLVNFLINRVSDAHENAKLIWTDEMKKDPNMKDCLMIKVAGDHGKFNIQLLQ